MIYWDASRRGEPRQYSSTDLKVQETIGLGRILPLLITILSSWVGERVGGAGLSIITYGSWCLSAVGEERNKNMIESKI